jgi:hypothetical protein
MSEPVEEYCTDQCDGCRNVIVRTYRGSRACGRNDRSAFRSAVKVLCLRHPERTREENIELASVWIADALEAGSSGPEH